MRLGDKIPVPELSANAASSLQRRVLAQVAAQPEIHPGWLGNRLRFAVAAAAVAGVALAIAINVKSAVDGRDNTVAGTETHVTELVTGADAVTVRLGDASVTLAPQTAASVIRRTGGGIDIALERGRVDCEVAPIPGREPLRVGAAEVEVEVVGTVFAVALAPRRETGAVRVEVERGVVAVRSPAGRVLVEAGQMWTAADGVVAMIAAAEPGPEPQSGAPGASAEAELIIDGEGDGVDDSVAAAEHAGTRVGRDRRDAASPGADHKAAGNNRASRDRRARRPLDRRRPPRHDAPNDPALLAAMKLESADPPEAVRQYSRIALENRGRVASYALYSKAYVEYFKLGDRSGAIETLDFFMRRFPRSREAQSALWLRVLGLCALNRAGECRAAAYSYIRRFPDGTFVDAASQVVNE
jgi:TolA-binding protein